MMRNTLFVVALLVACASAARLDSSFIGDLHSEGFPGGLKALQNNVQALLGRNGIIGRHHEEGAMENTAYASIRFTVPPSEGDKFEEQWMKLEDMVRKEEEEMQMFDLKSTATDNLFYLSYGEWSTHHDLHDHLASDHFLDFAEYVDDNGIRWELNLLKNLSEDVEEDQGQERREHRHGRKGRRAELSQTVLSTLPADASDAEVAKAWGNVWASKDLTHVLITYFVPPMETHNFIDAWTDLAEDTIDEKHNRVYSLRKLATDNSRFYAYGTWDSMGDYLDHFESKHVGKYLDRLEDMDVVWFLTPLDKVGNERE